MLYKTFKFLHVVGIILFLGSIFGHVATSVLGGVPGDAGFLAARQNISALTRVLTLPGLGLALVSGVGLALVGRVHPLKKRWLLGHGSLAVAIFLLSVSVVVPAGHRVLEETLRTSRDGISSPALQANLWVETSMGAVNMVLSLLAIGVAVWRPRFGRSGVDERVVPNAGSVMQR